MTIRVVIPILSLDVTLTDGDTGLLGKLTPDERQQLSDCIAAVVVNSLAEVYLQHLEHGGSDGLETEGEGMGTGESDVSVN